MAVYVVRLHGFAIVEAESASQAERYVLDHSDCFIYATVVEASDTDKVGAPIFKAE